MNNLLDPANLTPEQLADYVQELIGTGYAELPRYCVVVNDILTAGISQFALEQSKARQWSNRILGLLQEIRQVSSHVARIAKGKRRLFENQMAVWSRDTRNNGSTAFKGVDATERKSLARLACAQLEEDCETWEHLALQVKTYIDHLNDKLSDLENAKQELRAQLWAVRVHGVLGEFASEGKSGTIPRDPVFPHHNGVNMTPNMADGQTVVPPVVDSVNNPDLDRLLGD